MSSDAVPLGRPASRPQRVLVTGATGGLGRNAVAALRAQGLTVRATGRRADVGAELTLLGAEVVLADLATATPEALARLLADVDAVWHTAALSSPWGPLQAFEAANVIATQHLLAAAGAQGVRRFVHVSTPAIYVDFTDRTNVPESFRAAKLANAYADTKWQAEVAVQAAAQRWPAMHCTVLRPRAIFGPHDQVLLPRLARVLRERGGRLPLPRGGEVLIDLTYVDNVVQALQAATAVAAEDVPSGAVFNITNHQPVCLREVLHALFSVQLDQALHIVSVPWPVMRGAAQALTWWSAVTRREPAITPYSVGALGFDMTLDNTRARTLLGYVPAVPMDEALRRTAHWLRQTALVR